MQRKDVECDDSSDSSESIESELSTDEGIEDRGRTPAPPPPPPGTGTARGGPVEREHMPPHHDNSGERERTGGQ